MGGGSRQWQKHTHSVPRDTQGGCSIMQGSDATFAHLGLAHQLIKLMGYEHREDAVGVGEHATTHTHTHIPTHSVRRDTQDGWSLG